MNFSTVLQIEREGCFSTKSNGQQCHKHRLSFCLSKNYRTTEHRSLVGGYASTEDRFLWIVVKGRLN
jgi:hypothetical protein